MNNTLAFQDSTPLVSVIVPVYNVEQYLKRCLDSIITQVYSNLEIILIDDGSKDSSGNICEEYLSVDHRINVVHQKNMGLSAARNTGLSIAKGAFIVFVDSDDWLKKEMIEIMLEFALQNKLQLVECGVINSHDFKNTNASISRKSFVENQGEAMFRLLMETNYSVWRRLYTKELVQDLRFIPGKVSEDVFFTIDCINKIEKQGYVSDQLYIYNTENFSITRSPYNLKKIAAKDAIHYPVEQTKEYGAAVRVRANYLLLRGLISHYQRILLHTHLDTNNRYSKQFKKEIAAQIKVLRSMGAEVDSLMLKGIIAKVLPIPMHRFLLKVNRTRIQLKRKVKLH